MTAKKIGILVGSLRKDSYTRKIAQALVSLAPASLAFEFIDIGELPLYNQDLEENGAVAPAAWTTFRQRVQGCDGVLFFTPEYNRSVPAALKNAIDVGSRPYGSSVWGGKPGAIVSVSPGAIGGFGANHHLRQSMVFLDVPLLQQPEAYIGGAANLLDDSGKLTNEGTQQFLRKFAAAYAHWVDTNARPAGA
ncbi:NADPH-dependent FMN reductase [Rugamonas apoptosis]|uniref:NAD(P)H-dependent oxidoreductase n=1 Tax=Rugamonas apoptosis TaxID=2758570 RepID=A0A7W2IN03_9BURK|nr:NAD(P)H-dependent oxidoreductase [Rugamonas apoptosis]MBA5690228.1 NAD(P)H-dependent oxidoreductase [Rugamonas apoptosis]